MNSTITFHSLSDFVIQYINDGGHLALPQWRQTVCLVVQVSLLWLQSQWEGSMALTELQHLCMQLSHVLVKLERREGRGD